MKVLKFFAKIFSCLFIVVFGALCLFTAVFLMIKNMISYESINAYVEDANIFDYSSQEVNDDSTTLRQLVEKELLSREIPVLTTDEILDSEELNTVLGDYIYHYSKYLMFNKTKPNFPSDEILNIVEEVYAKNENKALSDVQKKDVSKYIISLGNKIDKSVFDNGEANEMFSINEISFLRPLFSSEYTVIVLAVMMLLTVLLISLCLGSLKRAINWCSKAVITNGVLLIVLSFLEVRFLVMYFNSHGLIDNLAILVVEKGFQNMLLYGGILIGVGLLLMIFSAILLKKEKSKKSSMILNEVIDTELENSLKKNNKKEVVTENNDNQLKVEDIDESAEKISEPVEEEKEELKLEENTSVSSENESLLEDEKEESIKDTTTVVAKYETELVPVSQEEEKLPTVVDDKPDTIDLKALEENTTVKNNLPEEEKKEIQKVKVAPLKEINIEVVHPKKGKDIICQPDDEEEEEIELL